MHRPTAATHCRRSSSQAPSTRVRTAPWRARGLGTALALLTVLACLGFAETRDPRPISLAALSQAETVLMSCEDDGASSTGEPLWCADPSAPHCSPAAPDTPNGLACDRPDVALLAMTEPERPYTVLTTSWPGPLAVRAVPRVDQSRLERPPRA